MLNLVPYRLRITGRGLVMPRDKGAGASDVGRVENILAA